MSLSLGLCQSQSLSQRLLLKQTDKCVCQSCFPKMEAYIMSHQELLSFVAWDVEVWPGEFYNGITDMILCNLYPFYKVGCRRFYCGKGPRLVDSGVSLLELRYMDNSMLCILQQKIKQLLFDYKKLNN